MTDSSPEAAATTPRDATFDRKMIDDLRSWRRRPSARRENLLLTADEVDALLAAADERDAYEREACAEPAPREAADLWPGLVGVMHIAGPNLGTLCGVERPSHVTVRRRYADCPACIEIHDGPFS